jgi:hypothetical protein
MNSHCRRNTSVSFAITIEGGGGEEADRVKRVPADGSDTDVASDASAVAASLHHEGGDDWQLGGVMRASKMLRLGQSSS